MYRMASTSECTLVGLALSKSPKVRKEIDVIQTIDLVGGVSSVRSLSERVEIVSRFDLDELF